MNLMQLGVTLAHEVLKDNMVDVELCSGSNLYHWK